jgi:predicted amino acid dehydrogenase
LVALLVIEHIFMARLIMDNFAFVLHPLNARADVARKYRIVRFFPESFIHFISRYFPSAYLSHITGIRSAANGKQIEGWFVGCPLTTRRMMTIAVDDAYHKIAQTCRLGQRLGAKIVGLGAFTSSVGDAGRTLSRMLGIPVTTGNSYTVAATVQAIIDAARMEKYRLEDAVAAVVGATGSIGKACVKMLSPLVKEIILIGRCQKRLAAVECVATQFGAKRVRSFLTCNALTEAQLIITATSAGRGFIESSHLSSGAVICDVARPFNVTADVRNHRKDVRVINGGMIEVPGNVDFRFDFGLPPRMAFACMAETMILALEGRFESYTIGRDITVNQINEISHLAKLHGFRVRLNQ